MIQGHKMFIDAGDSLRLTMTGHYEPFETEVAMEEINAGDTVVDIGANIGYYTLLFARKVGSDGMVFAFEPDSDNFKLLQKNISANAYANVISEQMAVTNKNQEIKLYQSLRSAGHHRIFAWEGSDKAQVIQGITLDDYLSESGNPVNLIKIDIEGAELTAIEGMTGVIEKNRGLKIITEYNPLAIKESGFEPEGYLDLLSRMGFVFYNLNEPLQKKERVSRSYLLSEYTPENRRYTNLLCTRQH